MPGMKGARSRAPPALPEGDWLCGEISRGHCGHCGLQPRERLATVGVASSATFISLRYAGIYRTCLRAQVKCVTGEMRHVVTFVTAQEVRPDLAFMGSMDLTRKPQVHSSEGHITDVRANK